MKFELWRVLYVIIKCTIAMLVFFTTVARKLLKNLHVSKCLHSCFNKRNYFSTFAFISRTTRSFKFSNMSQYNLLSELNCYTERKDWLLEQFR